MTKSEHLVDFLEDKALCIDSCFRKTKSKIGDLLKSSGNYSCNSKEIQDLFGVLTKEQLRMNNIYPILKSLTQLNLIRIHQSYSFIQNACRNFVDKHAVEVMTNKIYSIKCILFFWVPAFSRKTYKILYKCRSI